MTQNQLVREILNYFKKANGTTSLHGIPKFGNTDKYFNQVLEICIEQEFIAKTGVHHLDFMDYKLTEKGKSFLRLKPSKLDKN